MNLTLNKTVSSHCNTTSVHQSNENSRIEHNIPQSKAELSKVGAVVPVKACPARPRAIAVQRLRELPWSRGRSPIGFSGLSWQGAMAFSLLSLQLDRCAPKMPWEMFAVTAVGGAAIPNAFRVLATPCGSRHSVYPAHSYQLGSRRCGPHRARSLEPHVAPCFDSLA